MSIHKISTAAVKESKQLTSATANIEHDLANEQVLIPVYKVAVSIGAHTVFEHSFMYFLSRC